MKTAASYIKKKYDCYKEYSEKSIRDVCHIWCEVIEEAQNDVKKEYEEKLRWIPVEEKLPKDNILVEVLNESCTPKYSYSVLKKRMWVNPYLNVYISPVPTHWRHIL